MVQRTPLFAELSLFCTGTNSHTHHKNWLIKPEVVIFVNVCQ